MLATVSSAGAQGARPDPKTYSFEFIPRGDLPDGARKVVDTPHGRLICIGGNNVATTKGGVSKGTNGRSCSWSK